MKKLIFGFVLGNTFVWWLFVRFMKWTYKVSPEAYLFAWKDIMLPAFRDMINEAIGEDTVKYRPKGYRATNHGPSPVTDYVNYKEN